MITCVRTFIYATAVCILLSTSSIAQETYDSRENLTFGLKAGLNCSNIYDSKTNDFNANPKAGFAAGMFLSVPIGKYLGVQPEFLFSQRGFKGSGNYYSNTYDLTRTLNYLDIPMLFACKPFEGLTILAGPQYSFLFNQHDSFKNSSLTIEQEQDFENDNIRKSTICFTGGLDINFSNAVIGIRAGWDMTNNKRDGGSETPRYKNVWAQGTFGFRIY